MLHQPPDLDHLRHLATIARDGTEAHGVRFPPTVFVSVHADHLLALLDATTPDQVATASAVHPRVPIGWLDDLANAVGDLNRAAANTIPGSPLIDQFRDHARRLSQLVHVALEATHHEEPAHP